MSPFCNATFKDKEDGGNNLLKEVLASGRPYEDIIIEVLGMIKRHCPPKLCPLAGNSVHCDREVLKERAPGIYNHMSHQILDVSTMLGECNRCVPSLMSSLWSDKPNADESHRAMNDVERSISTLSYVRKNVLGVAARHENKKRGFDDMEEIKPTGSTAAGHAVS